jgi:hypothetical protein
VTIRWWGRPASPGSSDSGGTRPSAARWGRRRSTGGSIHQPPARIGYDFPVPPTLRRLRNDPAPSSTLWVVATVLVGRRGARRGLAASSSSTPTTRATRRPASTASPATRGLFDQTELGQPGAFPRRRPASAATRRRRTPRNCGMCHLKRDKPGTFVKKPALPDHTTTPKHLEKDEQVRGLPPGSPGEDEPGEACPPPMKNLPRDATITRTSSSSNNGQCFACHRPTSHHLPAQKPGDPSSVTRGTSPGCIRRSRGSNSAGLRDLAHQSGSWCADCHAITHPSVKPSELNPETPWTGNMIPPG